jgi:hypothetical protein
VPRPMLRTSSAVRIIAIPSSYNRGQPTYGRRTIVSRQGGYVGYPSILRVSLSVHLRTAAIYVPSEIYVAPATPYSALTMGAPLPRRIRTSRASARAPSIAGLRARAIRFTAACGGLSFDISPSNAQCTSKACMWGRSTASRHRVRVRTRARAALRRSAIPRYRTATFEVTIGAGASRRFKDRWSRCARR